LVQDSTPFKGIVLFSVLLKVATIAIFCDEITMIVGIMNIYEFDKIRVIEFLNDFYLVVKKVDVGHVHISDFDYFDCIPCAFDVVANPFVNFAAISTSDEIFEVEAVASHALLSFVPSCEPFFSIAFFHVDGTICVCQMHAGHSFADEAHLQGTISIGVNSKIINVSCCSINL
jgi:hypothetical protein